MLPDRDLDLFRPYLAPGEQILWSGRPYSGIAFRYADIYLIPFSLIWGGFAIYCNVSVWSGGAPLGFAIFGLPFLALGIYMMFGRFLHDAAIRRSQAYAVTDKRVLVVEQRRSPRFTALDLKLLPALQVQHHSGGSGTISFDNGPLMFGGWRYSGFEFWTPALSSSPRFYRIDEAQRVYRIITERSS